jgi:hypothetical protein
MKSRIFLDFYRIPTRGTANYNRRKLLFYKQLPAAVAKTQGIDLDAGIDFMSVLPGYSNGVSKLNKSKCDYAWFDSTLPDRFKTAAGVLLAIHYGPQQYLHNGSPDIDACWWYALHYGISVQGARANIANLLTFLWGRIKDTPCQISACRYLGFRIKILAEHKF